MTRGEALIEHAESVASVLSMEHTPFQLEQAINFLLQTVPHVTRAAEAERDRLRAALQRVKTNADSWHGPEGLRTGHARALAVIADWCDDALAREDKP